MCRRWQIHIADVQYIHSNTQIHVRDRHMPIQNECQLIYHLYLFTIFFHFFHRRLSLLAACDSRSQKIIMERTSPTNVRSIWMNVIKIHFKMNKRRSRKKRTTIYSIIYYGILIWLVFINFPIKVWIRAGAIVLLGAKCWIRSAEVEEAEVASLVANGHGMGLGIRP